MPKNECDILETRIGVELSGGVELPLIASHTAVMSITCYEVFSLFFCYLDSLLGYGFVFPCHSSFYVAQSLVSSRLV